MLQCISFKSASAASPSLPNSPATINLNSHPPVSQGNNSTEETPRSSTQPSPTVNLTREYTLNVLTDSYNEMWSRVHVYDPNQDQEDIVPNNDSSQLPISDVLQPNRQCVEEALSHIKPNTLTRLVSTYFDHSENTTNLCLSLHQSVYRARKLYTPLHEVIDLLPLDLHSISQSQCQWAFGIFQDFLRLDNPFPPPDSNNFHDMRRSFSQLKQQLDIRLRKLRSRVRLLSRTTAGCAICIIGTVVGVAISAAFVASHALVAVVAGPLCSSFLPRHLNKNHLASISQLDAAAKGTYVLNNDLDTIDRLVARLHTAIEGDKLLVRIGLEREMDKYTIHEVVKHIRKNHLNLTDQLKDLDEHICLCFNTVNRARSLLLREIDVH